MGTNSVRQNNWNQKVHNNLNSLSAMRASFTELLSIYHQEGWGIGGEHELTEDYFSVPPEEQHNAMAFATDFLHFIEGTAALPQSDRTGFLQPYLIP